MSKRETVVVITPPASGVGVELVGQFTGYPCGKCHGNGYYIAPEVVSECIRRPCSACHGTGLVKCVVTVDWTPDGEVKPYFKEDFNQ